ncbi:hypothetical protein JL721_8304 [Aureococcus anophagefferens]|nr:hypothetical protein JL721_8304 [Aureococcus anophagefferens]
MMRRASASASALLLALLPSAGAFGPAPRRRAATRVAAAEAPSMDEDWTDSQWSMYASQSGRWEGVWTTFNDQGIETMSHEGVWDVQLVPCPDGSEGDAAVHKLEVPTRSGAPREIPVGTYRAGALGRQVCAGAGMCSGPSLLRSGLMSTELILRHGASRLRVTLQHAPAEPAEGSELDAPALLCYRCVVSRERCDGSLGAPTREIEAKRWDDVERGAGKESEIPNFKGSDLGRFPLRFLLDEVEPDDLWHEFMRTGEASYNLVLPGGIRIQAPQVVQSSVPAPMRVAWMPNGDELLRAEAVVVALEPTDDDRRFLPPKLVTSARTRSSTRAPSPRTRPSTRRRSAA